MSNPFEIKPDTPITLTSQDLKDMIDAAALRSFKAGFFEGLHAQVDSQRTENKDIKRSDFISQRLEHACKELDKVKLGRHKSRI